MNERCLIKTSNIEREDLLWNFYFYAFSQNLHENCLCYAFLLFFTWNTDAIT